MGKRARKSKNTKNKNKNKKDLSNDIEIFEDQPPKKKQKIY